MDAELLETSLALVDTPDDDLTRRFHAILLERHPVVRPFFAADPALFEDTARQAKLLRSVIVSVVDHLDDPVWLTETLGGLGARFSGRGTVASMYDAVPECMVPESMVSECMVAAMAERGGSDWTPQMTDAWVEALDAVSGLMMPGHPVETDLAS